MKRRTAPGWDARRDEPDDAEHDHADHARARDLTRARGHHHADDPVDAQRRQQEDDHAADAAAALVRLNGGILGVPLSSLEPLAYAAGALMAVLVAVLAALAPATRAASIQPMVAMRSE